MVSYTGVLLGSKHSGVCFFIGKNLKRLRKEKMLTLEDLSEASGVSRGNISHLQSDDYPARISTIKNWLRLWVLRPTNFAGSNLIPHRRNNLSASRPMA
jgi:transcriptional regulator with XRE-family HTH domain